MATPTFRPLAAYGIYLPTFAVSPKLARETVYMPSQVAAQVLGKREQGKKESDARETRGALRVGG
jgi:hypothetical protein